MGVFWNSADQERLLTLVSLTHLHWLPGKNQFYPTSRLQLGPPRVCKFRLLALSQGFLGFSSHICEVAFVSTFLHQAATVQLIFIKVTCQKTLKYCSITII